MTTPRFGQESLTQRAWLTLLSNLLQQIARFLVGFATSPIVIRGLGTELYGAWGMIQQSVGYLALSDLRPMGTLKFTLAVGQHHHDWEEKRRQVGASIIIWGATLPLYLILGLALVVSAPTLIKTSPKNVGSVQIAVAVMVACAAFERIISLPSNILRGVNLDYRAMGLNAATMLVGGVVTVVAIRSGWGLPGVAAAGFMGILISGVARYLIMVRAVEWFGVSWPTRQELGRFTKLSIWLFLSTLAGLLLNSSDVLLLGVITGPETAALYVTTGAALRMIFEPLSQIISAGNAGVARLCGGKEWKRGQEIRVQMHLVGICGMGVIGAGIVVLNRPFLSLWLGEGYYVGHLLNGLLVVTAFQMVSFRIESVLMDSLLEFRRKTYVMITAGATSLVVGAVLASATGVVGIALGLLLGRIALLLWVPRIVRLHVGRMERADVNALSRALFAAALLIALAVWGAPYSNPTSWVSFVALASLVGGLAVAFMALCGLTEGSRRRLVLRLRLAFSGDR